jgi:hypothetical protein
MLNIQFKRNSQPIDDEDLQAVIAAVKARMDSESGSVKDQALLLAKMVFRIEELKREVAELRNLATSANFSPVRFDTGEKNVQKVHIPIKPTNWRGPQSRQCQKRRQHEAK